MSSIEKFEFLVSLQSLAETSGLLIGVSRSLQAVGTDIIKALGDVKCIAEILINMRQSSEDSFQKIFNAAEKLANSMKVAVEKPRTVGRSVFIAGAITDEDSIANYYRIQQFLPLLDDLISHLRDRFGPSQKKSLSLMGLVPAYIAKDFSILKPAVEMYADLLPSEYEAQAEFIVWQHKWQGHEMAAEINTAVAALQVCRGETLPNIKVLLQILATFPVTTAEPERVFSRLERTATAIRNMDETRLEALVLLQAHLDKTPSLDSVLDKFAMTEARRLQLML